jgi:phosphatidylserine decarboxylase
MRPALFLQHVLPHRALSRIVHWATRWTWRPWKDWLISTIIKSYNVDMRQAREPDPRAYPNFNAFFTRALKDGARPAPVDPRAVACPADGTISQIGAIVDGRIFQAKGFDFSAAELVGDELAALPYADGYFATIYLSPRDYHRVHMPLAGTLRETVHIPGRLFSVAPFTVDAVPRLFARNERLVCHFDGEGPGANGAPFCVVMVGAMLVSGIETVWSGAEVPPYASTIVHKLWSAKNIRLERCAEMARFNMGSTVILLLPRTAAPLCAALGAGAAVEVGQTLSAQPTG